MPKAPAVPLTLKPDFTAVRRAQAMLDGIPNGYRKAAGGALNDVAKTVRSRITKRIAKTIALKQKDIRNNIRLSKRGDHITLDRRVRVVGGRKPLIKFGAKQKRRGVSYRIEKGGKRTTLPGVFLAEMPVGGKTGQALDFIRTGQSGHVGVFKRRGKSRLPISELDGPSIPAVYQHHGEIEPEVLGDIPAKISERIIARSELLLKRSLK